MKKELLLGALIMAAGIALLQAGAGEKSNNAPQKFNLADLANGESRTFGEGDHTLTVTRRGDDVEIHYNTGETPGKTHTLHCTVGKDRCFAYTVSDEGKGNVVVLSKSGAHDSEGSGEEVTKVVLADGDADQKQVMVLAGDGDDPDHVVMRRVGPGTTWTTDDGTDGKAGVHVIQLGDEGGTMLRCPEGDATLTLKKGEESSGPYFCPKHNLKMEPVKGHVIIKKLEVDKSSKGEEH